MNQRPNEAPDPTPMSVTSPACAGAAPATVVANPEMESVPIFSSPLAARESVLALRDLLLRSGFSISRLPQFDPNWGGFLAKREDVEIAVDWYMGSGLTVHFTALPNEEVRAELERVIAGAKLPEDHII